MTPRYPSALPLLATLISLLILLPSHAASQPVPRNPPTEPPPTAVVPPTLARTPAPTLARTPAPTLARTLAPALTRATTARKRRAIDGNPARVGAGELSARVTVSPVTELAATAPLPTLRPTPRRTPSTTVAPTVPPVFIGVDDLPLAGIPFDTNPVGWLDDVTPVSFPGAKGGANGAHFYGLSYSPFGLGDNRLCPPWNDFGGQCLLETQVREDIRGLANITRRIKTYSSVCTNATAAMMDEARQQGMTVMFGVWLSDDVHLNLAEFRRAVYFLEEYQDIVTHVMLGNEPVFVLGIEAEMVARSVVYLRAMMSAVNVSIPIGVADIYNLWMNEGANIMAADEIAQNIPADRNYTSIAKVVDWAGLNSHAYWGGVDPITGNKSAAEHVLSGCDLVSKKWHLPCIITETGYPTEGPDQTTRDGTAKTGASRQNAFWADMEALARKKKMPVYAFEPFDGNWKDRFQPFIPLDYSFGIMTCDRKMKKGIKLPPLGAL